MESTNINNPALRIPPPYCAASKKKRKLLFFIIVFIGCYSILVIYYETKILNRVYNKNHAGSIEQGAMHEMPALNVPIQKTTSTEQGEGIKKIIQEEQEQQTAQEAERKRIGSHNHNNDINNDGTATDGSTSNAAAVQEQDKIYSLLADNDEDTNSSIATTTSTDTSASNDTTNKPPPLEESSTERDKKYISYEIVKDLPLRAVYDVVGEGCNAENGFILSEPFQAPGLLDFSTLIDTNLNILYVGDSVAQQFAQVLQEATHPIKRETIRYTYGNVHESTHIALTPSGGTVAGTRVTGPMINITRDEYKWFYPQGGGGWHSRDIREMKRLIRHWRPTETIFHVYNLGRSPCEKGDVEGAENATFPSKEEYPCEEKDFDVVVHQFAPGWQPKFNKTICWSTIDEMVNMSFDYLGANTVVLQTIQIMNNAENIAQLIEVNSVIWKYARDFQTKEAQRKLKDGRTRRVIVMDMFAYTVSLFLQNSMVIGLVSNEIGATLQRQLQESIDFDSYLNLTMSLHNVLQITFVAEVTKWGKEIIVKRGHVCANANCDKKSLISSDGMHWCTKATGGRINAALACLLRCSFEEEAKVDKTVEEMKQCEWRCNKQYMSLAPVPWDDAEEIEVNFNMVDLQNKEFRIQNKAIALENYVY